MTAQAKLHPKIVTEMENNSSAPLEVEHVRFQRQMKTNTITTLP